MNKAEFIQECKKRMDETRYGVESYVQMEKIVNTVLDTVMDVVAEGEKITFSGFGSFTPYQMKARKGRNVATNTTIDIPAKVVPKFKPSNKFKEYVLEKTSNE